jgi:hypothetical protein
MGRNDKHPGMHASRAAVLAQRKRRRNLLIAAIVLAVALTQLITFWTNRSNGDAGSSAAPGYREPARSIDTRPFALAEPGNRTATTLPLDFNRRATTTQATIPPVTLPPAATDSRDDPVCQAIGKLYDLVRSGDQLAKDPPNLAKVATERLMAAADLVEGTNDPQYQTAIGTLRSFAAQLAGKSELDEIIPVLQALLVTPTPEVASAAAPLTNHASQACPGLVQVHSE